MEYTQCWFKPICERCPKECSEKCIDFTTMVYLAQKSRIPESRWFPQKLVPNKDKEAFDRLNELKLDIYEFVQKGNNLLIHSSSAGNGKTTWATKLMLSYFSNVSAMGKYPRGVFVNVPLFLFQYKQSIGNPDKEITEMVDLILKCDLVIWDDIGAIKYTDFEYSILLPLIDSRVFADKSNIFTANGTYDELVVKLGVRIGSRVVRNSECIKFDSYDNRGIYGRASNTI